jgi:uncharacterized protein DUF922
LDLLFNHNDQPPNQWMKPTAPLRCNFRVFATTPCRGLSFFSLDPSAIAKQVCCGLTARGGTDGRLALVHTVLALALVAMVPGSAIAQLPPTQKEIADGYLPYHRLVVQDFPINDTDHSPRVVVTYGFCHYACRSVTVRKDDHFSARVTKWVVRSGFDRNRSWRKGWFKSFNEILPHEQGHLDITILHCRRLARMNLDELPVGQGNSAQAAAANLKKGVEALFEQTIKEGQAEQDAYDAATSGGANQSKQREWTATIRERLKKAGIAY